MTAARAEAGFTLIELLVAVSLLSLLLVLVFGGLRFGVRAWDGAQAHGTRSDELRVVQDLLRREIEAAYPLYDASDPDKPRIDFTGAPDGLAFEAPAPQAMGGLNRTRIVIGAARDGREFRLVLRVGTDAAEPLIEHLKAVRVSYFGDGRWNDSWSGRTVLPRLVRLRLEFPHGDGRVWPDLIAAPHVEADAACLYDVATRHCQGRP